MKGGIGTNLFVLEALMRLNLRLAGDLIFETVVDEEFGGSNGTLAGRLKGYLADAAVISEPTFLRVCPAQRGGRTAHIVLTGSGGVLRDGMFPAGITDQLSYFLQKVKEFAQQRRQRAKVHELYRDNVDPVPVSITKIFTSPWGPKEPITVPDECRIEMYWQLMPGETQSQVQDEFFLWIDAAVQQSNGLLRGRPEITFPIRWLPGSAISPEHNLVTELADCAGSVLGEPPPVAGIEGPCDLYVFQLGFGIPAVLWGAKGGNTHGPDEYLEIDSVVAAAKTLLRFVCRWCGVQSIG
jgi:acetylornithine deacetylase